MSEDCCVIPGTDATGIDVCPDCGQRGITVAAHTVNALVIPERALAEGYPDGYVCKNRDCSTLYFFGSGIEAISRDEINVPAGFKASGVPQLVCYCYEHTREEIQEEYRSYGESAIEASIREKVNAGSCSCEVNNPTGRCCLSDVRATYKDLEVAA